MSNSTNFTLPGNTLFYELERAIKLYRKLAQSRINEFGYDVSLNQLILLIQIAKRPESTQVELSEVVFKDFASVTRMVQLLVKKGFLTRVENQTDRRVKNLALTPEAVSMVEKLIPVIEAYRKEALLGIEEQDVANSLKLLKRLSQNAISGLNT